MLRWIHTKDEKWAEQWDKLVQQDPRSTFLQNIYRVKSYTKYGMDWELLIGIDENENIVMGSANVIVKFPFFKLYICSYGPTISNHCDIHAASNLFVEKFIERAVTLHAFVSQISLSTDVMLHSQLQPLADAFMGNVTSLRNANLIPLKDKDGNWLTKEQLIEGFLPNGRRDVRASYRRGLVSKVAISNAEIRTAYACFEDNAKNKGYFVRSWKDIGESITEGANNQLVFMLMAWFNGDLQGAILLERSTNTLSYTMGGVYRHVPDLLTGYFLQMEAMLLAQNLELEFYDISHGGPKEVQRFKGIFNPTLTPKGSIVHFRHHKLKYKVFKKATSVFKKQIPRLISLKQKLFS